MRFDELNEGKYLLFAIKFYDNPQSVTREDFEDDLKRIKYIKRLLKRYKNTGELKTHLILNHLTVLFNVFNDATIPLLFYNLEDDPEELHNLSSENGTTFTRLKEELLDTLADANRPFE